MSVDRDPVDEVVAGRVLRDPGVDPHADRDDVVLGRDAQRVRLGLHRPAVNGELHRLVFDPHGREVVAVVRDVKERVDGGPRVDVDRVAVEVRVVPGDVDHQFAVAVEIGVAVVGRGLDRDTVVDPVRGLVDDRRARRNDERGRHYSEEDDQR